MSYNYITDSHTNAVYKTTSPEGAILIQRYMNQVGGSRIEREMMRQKPSPGQPPQPRLLHHRDHKSTIEAAIREMRARTGKLPITTISFLDDADLDVDVAVAKSNEVTPEDWTIIMKKLKGGWFSADRLGNYTPRKVGKPAQKQINLAVSRLHRLMWDKASQQEKQPYEDVLAEWLTQREREIDACEREKKERAERGGVARINRIKLLASRAAQQAWRSSELAAKSASEVVNVAALDKEFGPNMQVYNAVHDLTTSRTLARLDSLISAVRNSSLNDPFSKLVSPDFRPESPPIDDDADADEDFAALISQAERSLMP